LLICDILAAVSIKNTVFLNVTPSGLVDRYQRYLGGRCFRLQGNLKMEAALSSWKLVTNLHTAQCHVPEYRDIAVLLDSTMALRDFNCKLHKIKAKWRSYLCDALSPVFINIFLTFSRPLRSTVRAYFVLVRVGWIWQLNFKSNFLSPWGHCFLLVRSKPWYRFCPSNVSDIFTCGTYSFALRMEAVVSSETLVPCVKLHDVTFQNAVSCIWEYYVGKFPLSEAHWICKTSESGCATIAKYNSVIQLFCCLLALGNIRSSKLNRIYNVL
jgi:hypothetical protein